MRAPRWEDIIADAMDARLEDVHTVEPGWVLDFDAESSTCTVQPSLMKPYQREDGQRGLARKPPCRSARICYPGGIRFNLEPGDPVFIGYCSGSLDNWQPGKNRTVDPGDDRMHNLTDALIVPMGKLDEVPDDGQVIVGYDRVSLGKSTAFTSRSPVARKSDLVALRAEITTFVATNPANPANAALTLIAGFLLTVINAMSSNVEAT